MSYEDRDRFREVAKELMINKSINAIHGYEKLTNGLVIVIVQTVDEVRAEVTGGWATATKMLKEMFPGKSAPKPKHKVASEPYESKDPSDGGY